MNPATRQVLNDPDLLAAREAHFARLKALYAGRPGEHAFVLYGVKGKGQANPYEEPERWVEEALDDLATQAEGLRDPLVFRPVVIEFGPYGVHFIDKMLGAEVFELEPNNWQAHYLSTPIGQLRPPDLERDPTWRLCQRIARAFLAAGVAVPLFGLPTIASVLNIAVNLYGQEILMAMYTRPEAARHDLQVIEDLLETLHRWYLAHIPLAQLQPVIGYQRTQPPGFGQLCGCTTQLLSRELYRDFVAPHDDALLSTYPHGGMIHLCGAHTHHIPVWRAMRSLRAVQLNDRACDDLAVYLAGLREDQMLYVNPYAEMPVSRIMELTGGRRTVIVADVTEPLTVL